MSQQNLNQPVDIRQIIGSTKTYKSKQKSHRKKGDPSQMSPQNLNQPVYLRQIIGSKRHTNQNKKNIADLIATSSLKLRHTNAKESYNTMINKN